MLSIFWVFETALGEMHTKQPLVPLSYSCIGTLQLPAQESDAHCTGLMSGTRHRAACPGHLVTGIRLII